MKSKDTLEWSEYYGSWRCMGTDWSYVQGKGPVFTVVIDENERDRSLELGDEIRIDGSIGIVAGLEMTTTGTEHWKERPIGILVR